MAATKKSNKKAPKNSLAVHASEPVNVYVTEPIPVTVVVPQEITGVAESKKESNDVSKFSTFVLGGVLATFIAVVIHFFPTSGDWKCVHNKLIYVTSKNVACATVETSDDEIERFYTYNNGIKTAEPNNYWIVSDPFYQVKLIDGATLGPKYISYEAAKTAAEKVCDSE